MRTTIAAAGAVAATAAIGGVAADPGSVWYRSKKAEAAAEERAEEELVRRARKQDLGSKDP
jgi:ribosomal protein L12E/L44/L45/RPP1/RPP2